MQQISSNYKNEIKQPSRHFECRVTIGKNIYTNESIVDIILDYPQAIDGFSIGNTTSQSLDLTLLNTGEEIYSTNQIKVEIGLQVGSAFEYILMGYYNVDEVSKNDYTIKFTAFDNMMKFETPYFSSLGDKPTLQQVVNELATITGISFVGSIPSYTVTKLDGYTCREVLSYVASLCGGNALITRDGKFTIKTLQVVDCSVTTETHFGLTTEEVPYKLGKITCVVDSEIELSKGATGIDSMELSFENPWMTESILNTLYQQLNGFSYLGFQTKWQGDLALDPYDLILIQDKKGTSHRVPILNQKFTYVGGLTSEIAAKGESKNKNSFSSSGPNANKTNRIVTEQAIIKEALINKANIQDLEAVSIRTQSLEATTAKIQDVIIDVAHISDLNAVNAKIESLQATDVTIQNAIINKADISELNAAVANINILNADLGVIKHLVNGNLSSENIQAGGITSDKLTIANGFIKDAMIDSLNANKITAGQINTALVQVSSASGNLVINDNTIQIRDVNRVRVQIGKDASNDYSMSVWDSSGKLMFDARGLKADAIKDSIIRNDMISADAYIDGSKLNISSVVSSINNSSSTLKASKVQFDGIAQTLEVAFNALKTQADGTKTQTESNTTAINVAQGKIKTLIQDTTITTSIGSTKLKDAYSKLEQTVGSLSSTIGSQQTIIDDHTGKITSTNSELSTLKQSVNGLSASVSSAQTTINSHTTLINQKADLTAVNDKINSAKNELNTSINKKANAVDVYNKTETYTKAQTDSAIKVAKDEINLGVSGTYETKTNVETKVSSTLNSAKSYADAKKTEAINTASTDATNKVNSAKTELNTAINKKANSADVYTKTQVYTKDETNSQINIAKEAINLGVSNTYETKANVTTKVSNAVAEARGITDTRNTNQNPQWYMTNYPRQTISEFKYANVIGIPGASQNYGTLTTNTPWADASGSYPVQTFKSSDYKTYERRGTSLTSWGGWVQIENAIDSQTKANTAKQEAITSANNTLTTTIANYYTKAQTDSQINVAKNAITSSVSSTYETKTDSTTKYDTATAIAKAMNSGKIIHEDIAFRNGHNGLALYNNTGNGNVKLERITKPSDCPTTSTHCMRITTTGTASPGWGGFYQGISSRANAVFIQKIVAKVPTGYQLNVASNSMGTGYVDKWLTNNKGTGKWETYIRQIICGSTGEFSNGGHVYISGGTTPTASAPLVWYIASCTAIDITDTDERVSSLTSRVSTAESKITDTAITNTVKQNFYTKTETDGKVTTVQNSMNSSITQLSNQIATKVDVNGVKSTIEQNPSSVQIGFNKISNALTVSPSGLIAKTQSGNTYFQLGYNGMTMYNPANGTHQWGKVAAINNKFTVASNGNSSGLSLGHHVNDNYVEDILCDSNGVVSVQRQINHNGVFYNNYGQMFVRQPGQGGWEITGRSDSQSIKPGGANQGAIGSNTQYINQSWIANRYNPSSLEFKHLSHYVDDAECLKLVTEIQAARYFYKEYDADGNDITTFSSRNSQLGLIYEDVRACSGRDLLTNEEDKAINDYNMASVLWGATRNINTRLNEVEYENILLRERVEHLESLLKNLIH